MILLIIEFILAFERLKRSLKCEIISFLFEFLASYLLSGKTAAFGFQRSGTQLY